MFTYPAGTEWSYASLRRDHERTTGLELYWEAHLDPMSGDYTPDEIDARELFELWRRRLDDDGWSKRLGEPWVDIYWFVSSPDGGGTFESAPFEGHEYDWLVEGDDFLSFYTWPENAETGELLNWLRLPVRDKLWRPGQGDKGGFIQEATGWKPSALQAHVSVQTLVQAVR